ncbi:hypothetical protein Acr_00g0078350 [Actinidia rufa]|uniref:CCHC-type domain-containing protein n=1 Tax=Actinidia rufa TaxID=165716 RepID=A0A7J0DVC2_9ERIC|nr:hypothetical protein Acr_00g0078350 [Actinidia rufa]
MEDILFFKDLHDPLENKEEKPLAKKDEEWRKMNRKTIGLIRQCNGHEVFHHVAQETSTYELWIKLKEMYQVKKSLNKALLMRRLVNLKLEKEATVVEHTSEFQNLVNQLTSVDLQFEDEMCFYCDQEGHIKRDCPKYKAHDQSSDTTAIIVMAVDESDVLLAASEDGKSNWVLDSGSAYHLCRDREVFSTSVPCEGRIWMANNTSSRVVGRGSVRFRMADERSVTLTEVRHVPNLWKNLISIGMLHSKGCRFDASGGTLRVFKENKEMLWEKKTRGLYRLEGSVQIGGATVRHGSSGISKENGQRKQPLHIEKEDQVDFEKLYSEGCGDAEASLFCSRFDQWRCSIQLYTQGRRDGATTTRKVTYFAAHSGGVCGAPQWGVAGHLGEKSYGGAGSEAVRKDNLKTSDYPPVGWRGRLLRPAHLDESKPTWMSLSPVAKPKPDWSLHGVSM